MGTPTRLQNVDDRGYVFMTEAADCQIVTSAVTVDDDPAVLLPASPLTGRRRMYIKNNNSDTDILYIGGSDVTEANGWPLAAGEELILDVTDDVRVYGIASSADTVDARILEIA